MNIRNQILIRYSIIILILLIVMGMIIGKASYIIFKEGDEWRRLVKTLRKEDIQIPPKRGNILATDGQLLSSSLPYYTLMIDVKAGGFRDSFLTKNIDSLSLLLSRKLGDRSAAGYKQHLLSLYKNKKSSKRNFPLSNKKVSHVDLKEIKQYPFFRMGGTKSGLHTIRSLSRIKPYGSLASRTIGDIYADEAKGARYGLEVSYDSLLRGTPGYYTRRKIGNRWAEVVDVEPIEGMDIMTTIDIEIQEIAERALVNKLTEINAQSGLVVVMETATGEIKAISNLDWRGGQYVEEVNHAFMDEVEPGSTFKIPSVIAALETGKVSITDTFDTGNGTWRVHGATMTDHNRDKGGYGIITLERAIQVSSNIGVAKAIQKAFGESPDKFVDALYKMKLNEPLDMEIPGAGKPKIRHPKTDPKTWSRLSLLWMSFGYEIQIPPIYTLAFYNGIANDGKIIKPILVKEVRKEGTTVQRFETTTINSKICSNSTLKQVKKMLLDVVEAEKSTGNAVQSDVVRIAGKTGTALISQGSAGYKSAGKAYRVSFCGYFPADEPKYTAIVVIQNPSGIPSGGTMAGGVFKNIAEQIYSKDPVEVDDAINPESLAKLPKVKSGNYAQLETLMDNLDIEYKDPDDNADWVKAIQGEEEITLSPVKLIDNLIPNVIGMGAKDAVYLLESRGLRVGLSGRGKVTQQSITPGSRLSRGQYIALTLN